MAFESGRRDYDPQERRWPLQVGKDKETDFLLEPPEGTSPDSILALARESDFGPLTSRAVTQHICVVLSCHICGNLLQQQ